MDHGEGRRLESFHDVLVDRPAPSATIPRRFPERWDAAHARYDRSKGWLRRTPFDDPWLFSYHGITFSLALSPAGQVGVFPEQADNWEWMRTVIAESQRDLSLLNLFAYTGGATLAALTAPTPHRVEVCHLDGAQSAVSWARRNAVLNGKKTAPIRWIVDDALTFLRREARRGRRYDGVILDPPAFGRGPTGKPWKLTDDLPRLLEGAAAVLSDRPCFLLLSWHDATLMPETVMRMMPHPLGNAHRELSLLQKEDQGGRSLLLGMALRFRFQPQQPSPHPSPQW